MPIRERADLRLVRILGQRSHGGIPESQRSAGSGCYRELQRRNGGETTRTRLAGWRCDMHAMVGWEWRKILSNTVQIMATFCFVLNRDSGSTTTITTTIFQAHAHVK